MTNLVVDAPVFLDYVLRTERGDAVTPHIEDADALLHAPHLCDVEVVSVIRRTLVDHLVGENRAGEALVNYLDLPVRLYGHRPLLGRILELRDNLSAYDATYLALAETLQASLLTTDGRFARAARTHGRCEVVSVSA